VHDQVIRDRSCVQVTCGCVSCSPDALQLLDAFDLSPCLTYHHSCVPHLITPGHMHRPPPPNMLVSVPHISPLVCSSSHHTKSHALSTSTQRLQFISVPHISPLVYSLPHHTKSHALGTKYTHGVTVHTHTHTHTHTYYHIWRSRLTYIS
jgi:hypothetical protein